MLLVAEQISKTYNGQSILQNIDFQIQAAQLIAVTGPSGSGKSTLLHLASGLLSPDSGTILFENTNIHSMSSKEKDQFRSYHMGFVFQFHHLLPEFTAWENVAMPLLIQGKSQKDAKAAALSMLELVDLSHRSNALPAEMSGGERQRTAIARAAVHKPKLIFADEPTGNLDSQTAQLCLNVFQTLQTEIQCSCLIATHDLSLASALDTHYRLQDGQLCKIQ